MQLNVILGEQNAVIYALLFNSPNRHPTVIDFDLLVGKIRFIEFSYE